MLQHTGGSRAVGEELSTVFLGGDGKPDGVFRHCDRAVAHKAVKAEAGNMQHVGRPQDHGVAFHRRRFFGGACVAVIELALVVAVHRHLVWHQRVERHHLILAVPDYLYHHCVIF